MMKENIGKVLVIATIILLMSGCLSSMVYKDSQSRMNQKALKAVRVGEDGVGIGVDLAALDVLLEQPWKQTFALIGDAGLICGSIECGKYIIDELESNDSSNNQDSGRDSNQVEINGDKNTVHIGDETTEIIEEKDEVEVVE